MRRIATRRRLGAAAALPMLLAACAAAPPAPPPLPLAGTGLVIGVLSYAEQAPALVRFRRLSGNGGYTGYALPVLDDPDQRRASFAGFLPPGVYVFGEASAEGRRFASQSLRLPFEVTPGGVHDAGAYHVQPVTELGGL